MLPLKKKRPSPLPKNSLGVTSRTYPADPAEGALRLFLRWFGGHFARSARVVRSEAHDGVLQGVMEVGRRWELGFTVLDTLSGAADMPFEATRAAVEQRLDSAGRSILLWVPRGAPLPSAEPGLSEIVVAIESAETLDDGRLQLRRPVKLFLRRTSMTGSVLTILGGLAAHWAQFTNRVPGSFQLNSAALFRLPQAQEERDELAERIVLAAQQPQADDSQTIDAVDCWSANDLGEGGSCVMGTPRPETDAESAALRRSLRSLLRVARESNLDEAPTRALVVLGAATYAEEEKLSWALRGMDPALYGGYDIVAIVADGLVKVLLEPPRNTLPWDVPLG